MPAGLSPFPPLLFSAVESGQSRGLEIREGWWQLWGPDPKAGCLGLCAIRPCWSYTGDGHFPTRPGLTPGPTRWEKRAQGHLAKPWPTVDLRNPTGRDMEGPRGQWGQERSRRGEKAVRSPECLSIRGGLVEGEADMEGSEVPAPTCTKVASHSPVWRGGKRPHTCKYRAGLSQAPGCRETTRVLVALGSPLWFPEPLPVQPRTW